MSFYHHFLFFLISGGVTMTASGFVVGAASPPSSTTSSSNSNPTTTSATTAMIDFQSDTSQFGRGEMHLSAMIQEGDTVVYQTGSWMVDGVEVGEGTAPISFEYCQIETIQVVWTHNCEHGVLRGIALELLQEEEEEEEDEGSSSTLPVLVPVAPLESVELGPEQLIARIPVEWNAEGSVGTSLVDLKGGSLWKPME